MIGCCFESGIIAAGYKIVFAFCANKARSTKKITEEMMTNGMSLAKAIVCLAFNTYTMRLSHY
jgi:sulfatase maturation enzyme AslB (radical SAM superfamily)